MAHLERIDNLRIAVHPHYKHLNPDLNQRESMHTQYLTNLPTNSQWDATLFMPALSCDERGRVYGHTLEEETRKWQQFLLDHPDSSTWPQLLTKIREASSLPEHIVELPNVMSAFPANQVRRTLREHNMKIDSTTRIQVYGEFLEKCVIEFVIKFLNANPDIHVIYISKNGTLQLEDGGEQKMLDLVYRTREYTAISEGDNWAVRRRGRN